MVSSFEQGPYIHALGWTGGSQYDLNTHASTDFDKLQRTLAFSPGTYPTLKTPAAREETLAALPKDLLKSSGVPRARSAAKSTVLASILGKSLAQLVQDRPGYDGDRGSIGVVSNSAIVPVFWTFEGVGVGQSWDRTDTMLLPASIPSSVVTMVSTMTGFHASAASFGNGAAGMVAAVEQAYLNFLHGRADYAVVICAEEACMPMIDAMHSLDVPREPIDGAAGLLLSRQRLADTDWQISFAETASAHASPELPAEWKDVPRVQVVYADGCSAYTGTAMPQALHEAMQLGSKKALIEITLSGQTNCLIGLAQ